MYQPYLIAKFNTGFDKELQPWLTPDDSQDELFDGFVYRGEWRKRDGYNYYATGERGGAPYTESRIVHRTTAEVIGAGDGVTLIFNAVLANIPVRRGTLTINYTIGAVPLVGVDNGLGSISGTNINSALSTINYTTGAVTLTFTVAPDNLTNITATYDEFPGNPVMMVANFNTASNANQLIVADTQYVNRYNPVTNRLDDISTTTYTGNKFNFFSWTNYPDATDVNRLIFTNNVDPIQSYDGTTITNWAYTSATITVLTALHVFSFKDRIVLLRTTETAGGPATTFLRRIRVSGFGANSDVLDSTAPGAGFIDLPSNTPIVSAAFNRDDLLIFTENETWALKFTGNDTTPFIPYKIDESRGSKAPFSSISYLSRTTTASPRGLIITDGYKVERMDNKIPDYSFNQIDPANFGLCFAGTIDEDRDNYLIHPSPLQDVDAADVKSDRILVANYEEDNFAVYRIPLSCMGNFVENFEVTWNDLLVYNSWDEFANAYASWNSFGFGNGTPVAIGGGHNGQIWRLNLDELEDNPLRIRAITYPDPVNTPNLIDVETDFFDYRVGDYIYFQNILGLTEINNKQFPIDSIITPNYVFRVNKETNLTQVYTPDSGVVTKVIAFESKTKVFNPFANADKKVRCGWLYMYVSSAETFLTDQNDEPVPAKITVEVYIDDFDEPSQVLDFAVSPFLANNTNLSFQKGSKKWTKLWINQTARQIQFKIINIQAGAKIKIQALMPGFAPVGRLI